MRSHPWRWALLFFLLIAIWGLVGLWAQTDGPGGAADTVETADASAEPAAEEAEPKPALIDSEKVVDDTLRLFGLDPGSGSGAVVRHFLAASIFGFTIGSLLVSFGIFVGFWIFRRSLAGLIFRLLDRMAKKTVTIYDDRALEAIRKPTIGFILILGFYLAIISLPIEQGTALFFSHLFRAATVGIILWGLLRVVDVVLELFREVSAARGLAVASFVPLMSNATKAFIVVIGVIMLFENLGFSVSGILTTLGLGGAALAFAAKDTIANLYGSLALALDRPFKVGDWIMVGDEVDGDVESIGLRSTRVRTWPKTVISIPNSVLANEKIDNWSRMPKRRVKQIVGVTYETTADQMEALLEDIRALLANDEGVHQEFIMVRFTDFGSSSLDILVYYFTVSTKWMEHLSVRERINLEIIRLVARHGLSIAFPTRTLYFEGDIARAMADGRGLGGHREAPDSLGNGGSGSGGRSGSGSGDAGKGLPG